MKRVPCTKLIFNLPIGSCKRVFSLYNINIDLICFYFIFVKFRINSSKSVVMKNLNYIIIIAFCFFSQFSQVFSVPDLHPIFDNLDPAEGLTNWRTSQEAVLFLNGSLNSKGLEAINISGSGQFSENSLSTILDNIPVDPSFLIVFDLRKESHGLINKQSISWTDGIINNVNTNLSLSDIEIDELERLKLAAETGEILINNFDQFAAQTLIVREIKTRENFWKVWA